MFRQFNRSLTACNASGDIFTNRKPSSTDLVRTGLPFEIAQRFPVKR